MTRRMKIVEREGQQRTVLGLLDSAPLLIGREAGEGGISLDRQAISRHHGEFLPASDLWVFKDLGSTNGSWLNGQRLSQEALRIVRPGDILQLADVAIELVAVEEEGTNLSELPRRGTRKLLVFSQGRFFAEFPVAEYGRSLAVGGTGSTLELAGDLSEFPSLTVLQQGEEVVAEPAFGVAVQINGVAIEKATPLQNGDEIRIGEFSILMHDPSQVRAGRRYAEDAPRQAAFTPEPTGPLETPSPVPPSESTDPASVSKLRGWTSNGNSSRTNRGQMRDMRSGLFGRGLTEEDDEETFAIDVSADRSLLSGQHGSFKSIHSPYEDDSDAFASLEDKILLLIGFGILVVLIALVVWWAVS